MLMACGSMAFEAVFRSGLGLGLETSPLAVRTYIIIMVHWMFDDASEIAYIPPN